MVCWYIDYFPSTVVILGHDYPLSSCYSGHDYPPTTVVILVHENPPSSVVHKVHDNTHLKLVQLLICTLSLPYHSENNLFTGIEAVKLCIKCGCGIILSPFISKIIYKKKQVYVNKFWTAYKLLSLFPKDTFFSESGLFQIWLNISLTLMVTSNLILQFNDVNKVICICI